MLMTFFANTLQFYDITCKNFLVGLTDFLIGEDKFVCLR